MIRTFLKWFVAFALCLVLQTTLVRTITIWGIAPDLLIVVLFWLAVRTGVLPGVYAGFLLGLGQDLYTPAALGQNALAKTVTGFFMGLFNERVMRTDPIIKIVIFMVSCLLHDMIFTIITIAKIHGSPLILLTELFMRMLPRAIYSALFVALVFVWDYYIAPTLRR